MKAWLDRHGWLRKEPPVFRFPTRIRWMGTILGFGTLSVAFVMAAYSERVIEVIAWLWLGITAQLLIILAWSEEKHDQ